MGIKVSSFAPTSSVDTSGKSTITSSSSEESFQDVLVLNETALKAMTIDDMVKKSATGAISPEAVDAAAIMRFRSTLRANIQSPVPTSDWDLGKPIKVEVPVVTPIIRDPVVSTQSTTTPSVNTPTQNESTVSTETIPNTGVLECSDELNEYFKEASETYGIDIKLLKCIAYAESNFDPESTSRSGAMGIMQLMPKTAEGLGVEDAYDPRQNILGGAKYISIQLERFDGNIELALAAYNAGPGAVQKYDGIPPYEETQNYVKKIMNIYNS